MMGMNFIVDQTDGDVGEDLGGPSFHEFSIEFKRLGRGLAEEVRVVGLCVGFYRPISPRGKSGSPATSRAWRRPISSKSPDRRTSSLLIPTLQTLSVDSASAEFAYLTPNDL
jgi:hypothetical protein